MPHMVKFRLLALMLAVAASPALATAARAADEPRKGAAADEEFITGLRKTGVMVGEAFICTPEATRTSVGQDALILADQIATHFGTRAAFIFSGAFGYGTGHPFDKATCAATLANYKDLQQKYLVK